MNWNKIFNVLLWVAVVGVAGFTVGKYFFLKPKFIVGEEAPSFSAVTSGGETLKLADLKGNIVLLDFWGSWCGPCRMENPKTNRLLKAFREKHGNGGPTFLVVGIGIEENEQSWQRAIANDGLDWSYQILDKATSLRFFDSPVANVYGVKQIPTKYLINEKGIIVKVNPTAEEIEKYLDQHFR